MYVLFVFAWSNQDLFVFVGKSTALLPIAFGVLISVKAEHPESIQSVFVTFDISNDDRSSEVNL